MSNRYFYGRVSSTGQSLDRQLESAKQYGDVDRIFTDKESGKNFNRAGYTEMKSTLKRGDEVIIHSLDRLGRNKELTKIELEWFKANGVMLRILDLPTTLMEFPKGQEWVFDMVNNILIEVLGTIAEQERETIKKRQREGIDAMGVDEEGYKVSSKTGRRFGRSKKGLPENFIEVYERQQRREISLKEAMTLVGISRTRWYELVKEVA